MKSNLVKILGTLGLIIAIAVILKSVFGVGKIGFSKLSNKSSKITFENCWDINDYESYEQKMKKSLIDSQIFEIDTSTVRVVRTTVWSDEFVQDKKDMQKKGITIDANKIDQDTMIIESYTDNFVTTKPFKIIDGYSRVLGTDKFVFNLRDGTYENSYKDEKYGDVSTYKSKCEKY